MNIEGPDDIIHPGAEASACDIGGKSLRVQLELLLVEGGREWSRDAHIWEWDLEGGCTGLGV